MADDDADFVAGGEEEVVDDIDTGVDTSGDSNLLKHHPECVIDFAESVAPKILLLASPPLNKDPNHRSAPFLTQYEKTKIIGLRANMLSQHARPYIDVPEHVTDVAEIARMELAQRRLPFLIRRPMPDGTHEYWRLSDLMIL
jgi:DNA-directed RNA polymerase I, II, and III subunit RPABC2